jgi:hypothetical protein
MSQTSHRHPRPGLSSSPLTITEVKIEPSPVLGSSKIYLYAAAGTVLGILLGVGIAFLPWMKSRAIWPSQTVHAKTVSRADFGREARDLGAMSSSSAGLTGHLLTEWDDRLAYRLAVEPSDPALKAAFALALNQPPRPLSVRIRLLDSSGADLCDQQILFKYDAGAALISGAAPPSDGASSMGDASGFPAAPGYLARLEAEELQREHGRDLFENDMGADGQIAAVHARGEMPCSKQAYLSTSNWSFTPDFPIVSQPAQGAKAANNPAAVATKDGIEPRAGLR